MDTITLTLIDANPERLAEELSAALGFPVAVYVRREAGQISEALAQRADGLSFSNADVTTAYSVAAAHDPAQLSTMQAAEQARQDARNAALAHLDAADLVTLQNSIAMSADLSALKVALADLVDLVGDLITLAQTA
jgi:hypothetical protein